MKKEYLELNKKLWNNRVEPHISSDFYNMEGFLKGETSLKEIELDLLGDVSGKSILHLQCHFGQDTLSLSRMGANCTGVDFSEDAIEQARKLNEKLGQSAEFICCDILELDKYLNKKFDIVFTSYGTITWFPDLDKWASIISHFLKSSGQLIFVEFHPVVWMFDDDLDKVAYKYNKSEPLIEEDDGSYADREAELKDTFVCWNHSLSEVFTALRGANLSVYDFQEYYYSPYESLRHCISVGKQRFVVKHLGDKIPYVYSMIASKKAI